jgi:hypothetical protein
VYDASSMSRVAPAWSLPIVLLLLALVGLASHSSDPSFAPSTSPRLGVLAVQILESVGALVVLASAALTLAALPGIRRRKPRDAAEGKKVHWAIRLALLIVYLALVGSLVSALAANRGEVPAFQPVSATLPTALLPQNGATLDTASEPWPSLPVVFALVSLLAAAAAAVWLWRQRSPRLAPHVRSDPLSGVIDDGLAALERESDPRRAVILAYHAMEHALARQGFDRNASEAPVEYMLRVLADVPDCSEPVHDLTRLFEEAKYSQHDVGPHERQCAVEALQSVRATLQASA